MEVSVLVFAALHVRTDSWRPDGFSEKVIGGILPLGDRSPTCCRPVALSNLFYGVRTDPIASGRISRCKLLETFWLLATGRLWMSTGRPIMLLLLFLRSLLFLGSSVSCSLGCLSLVSGSCCQHVLCCLLVLGSHFLA